MASLDASLSMCDAVSSWRMLFGTPGAAGCTEHLHQDSTHPSLRFSLSLVELGLNLKLGVGARRQYLRSAVSYRMAIPGPRIWSAHWSCLDSLVVELEQTGAHGPKSRTHGYQRSRLLAMARHPSRFVC